MDPNPTPFPGKNQSMKSKPNRNLVDHSKTTSKETSISRQNRVFGTVRNTNIPIEKPFSTKAVPRRQPDWNPTTRVPIPEPAKHNKKKNYINNPSQKPKPRSKPILVSAEKVLEEKEEAIIVNDEKTPVSTVQAQALLDWSDPSASTYQSAKICSKCRFDKLETSSYWLGHIKLSESVGKHFVSAAFFRLALESKAEPIKKLRFELKRYLARNGNIEGLTEWREVCVGYGVLKDENSGTTEKLETPKTTNEVVGLYQGIEATNVELSEI